MTPDVTITHLLLACLNNDDDDSPDVWDYDSIDVDCWHCIAYKFAYNAAHLAVAHIGRDRAIRQLEDSVLRRLDPDLDDA